MTIRERAERIVRRVERLNANNLHRQAGDIDDCYRVAQNYLDLLDAAKELAELMEATVEGEYKPDSFTTQPVLAALAKAVTP